jgi:hypothetical protein
MGPENKSLDQNKPYCCTAEYSVNQGHTGKNRGNIFQYMYIRKYGKEERGT